MRHAPARGKWAEDRALDYLVTELGYKVVARNVRLAGGEIDLVMRDSATLVFVEVKARRGGVPQATESLTRDKLRRLGRAAAAFLARGGVPAGGCRFDVVAVGGEGSSTCLVHVPSAFDVLESWSV